MRRRIVGHRRPTLPSELAVRPRYGRAQNAVTHVAWRVLPATAIASAPVARAAQSERPRTQLACPEERGAGRRSALQHRSSSHLAQSSEIVRWTIATDSSPFEAEVDPNFPSTRVMFMQTAAVIVDLLKMRERQGPFADPVAIREAQRADVIAGVLPSSSLMSRSRYRTRRWSHTQWCARTSRRSEGDCERLRDSGGGNRLERRPRLPAGSLSGSSGGSDWRERPLSHQASSGSREWGRTR